MKSRKKDTIFTAYNTLLKVEQIMRDDLFEGKDWACGDTVDRIEWLVAMMKNYKERLDRSGA